jgi:radical SAM superfamily enzyme YgiQ (UPF0313 family)
MDLLLTHGYFLDEDAKEQKVMKPYAPLGILYLCSYLRKKGFDVEIYDTTFGTWEELLAILRDGPPSVLGVYANMMTRSGILRIIREARAAGWIVILGGPEPPNYPDEYLGAGAHVVVRGEGERTLEELLTGLRAEGLESLNRIDGIAFMDGQGSVIQTRPRDPMPDLNSQPWPDRERINLTQYMKVWREHHGSGSLSLITARGCPYHCRWCSHSTYGRIHRRRSVHSVVDEVDFLLARFNPDMLWIADDVFTINHPWILNYRNEMRRRGLQIPFECITRGDRVSAPIADALADLGCFRVWIGSESGSQRVLDAMERGVTIKQVRSAVQLFRERGIQTGMFLMWGYDGEEIEDIEATVDHVKASMPDIFLTTVAYPIKGTPYYEDVAPRLVNPTQWEQTTDRELRIRNRHSRNYYRFADLLLKNEVALHKLSAGERGSNSPHAARLKEEIEKARRGMLETASEVEA